MNIDYQDEMLYERDYRILNEEEKLLLEKAEDYLKNNRGKLFEFSPSIIKKYHELRPEASYYYLSLFPNNYLSTTSLKDKNVLKRIEKEFYTLLNKDPSERQILIAVYAY